MTGSGETGLGHKGKFAEFIDQNYTTSSGAAAPDELLKSATTAYNKAARESTRLFVMSAVALSCYAVKIAGLRIDLIFIDKKIFEMPYGIFVFCCAAQILYLAAILRANDARVFERIIRHLTEIYHNDKSGIVHIIITGESNWINPQFWAIKSAPFNNALGILASIFYALFSIITLLIYITPPLSGVLFLINYSEWSGISASPLQWWAVLITTILSSFAFAVNAIFNFRDMD